MYYLVYRTINLINGKYYTGAHETNDLNDGYLGSGKTLKLAIKKYGIENFKRVILHEALSREEMFEKEKGLVDFGAQSYNLHEGGNGGWSYVNNKSLNGKNFKPGHKFAKLGGLRGGKRAVQLKVGIHHSDFVYTGLGFKGKHHTEEFKKRLGKINSKRLKGKNNPWFGMMWIHNPSTQENTRIKNTLQIPDGWIKGRKI